MKNYFLLLSTMFMVSTLWSQTGLYDIENVLEIKVYLDREDWDVVLDSLKQEGEDERYVGKVEVNGEMYEGAGVRFKGNSSYFNVRKSGSSKLPFNIKVNETNKELRLPGDVTTLKLSNVFRDPSYIREVLAYEIARKYMPASRANFAKLYVNDAYLGIYNCTESVDEPFLDQYFGNHQGPLVKCDPNWHAEESPDCPKGDKASLMYLGEDTICYMPLYELKTDSGWLDLVELTRILNKEPEKLETILDIDQTLWMMAFNNVLVNLDSYTGRLCHNYYLYRDTLGIYHPVVWDMNLCFGGFRYTGLGTPLSNEDMQTMSPFIHFKQKNEKRPLITQLLSNEHYRKVYIAHVKTIVEEVFASGEFSKRSEEIQQLIAPFVEQDSNKLYSLEAFQKSRKSSVRVGGSSIIGLDELMAPRTAYLKNHALVKKEGPKISDVKHLDYTTSLAVNATIEGAERAWLYYRYGKEGTFSKLEMFDDSGHNDEMEADGIWGATLDTGENLKYYIVAENKSTATLSPERASYEFYEVEAN